MARQIVPDVLRSTNDRPLVSVILPTYNRLPWLLEAVATVRAQTWPHWELLVVDDGSTDATTSALPADPRIRIIQRPHTGNVAAAHNAGLQQATGDYVGFLDSDDRWHPDKLALQVARVVERSDSGWCHGRLQLVDEAGQPIPFRTPDVWTPREGDLLPQMLRAETGISLLTVLVRRTLAVALGFDERMPFGDDFDFLLRLAQTAPACAVSQLVADAREHPDRGTAHRHDHALSFIRAFRKCRRQVDDRTLKYLCWKRACALTRYYLARSRATGQLGAGIRSALGVWTQSL